MKTREQAEQRALELYPEGEDGELSSHINLRKRESYIQCWEDMQSIKNITQSTDESVNVSKSNQKELLCEMMRKDEESGVYDDIISHALRKGSKGVVMPKCVRLGDLNKNNQLRGAAKDIITHTTQMFAEKWGFGEQRKNLEKALK